MHNLAEKLGIFCAITTTEKEIAAATYDKEMIEALVEIVGKDGQIWCIDGELHANQDEHIDRLFSELKKRKPSTRIEVFES